jgi:hypothetical protein
LLNPWAIHPMVVEFLSSDRLSCGRKRTAFPVPDPALGDTWESGSAVEATVIALSYATSTSRLAMAMPGGVLRGHITRD